MQTLKTLLYDISEDEDEQLGMPDDMEVSDRAPTKGQYIPDEVVEEYVNKIFNTPHNSTETQEDDEGTDVYEPEDKVKKKEEHEPEVVVEEEPAVPEVQVIVWRNQQ